MPRIAKHDVNAALDRIAQNIRDAAGKDGITSRKDIKAKLQTMSGTEKRLTDMFYRFVDHRDAKPGARITGSDIARGSDYAKEHLVAKYDVNHNGLSHEEIERMSVTGQLAVKLAAELKGVELPKPTPTSALGKLINEAAKGADYISESDSTPAYVETPLPAGQAITGDLVMQRFATQLEKAFSWDGSPVDLADFTTEVASPAESARFFDDMVVPYDPGDPFIVDNSKAWAKLKKVFDDNITDLTVVRVGPRDEMDRTKMAQSQGAYEYYLVGRSADGKLAGVTFESVET